MTRHALPLTAALLLLTTAATAHAGRPEMSFTDDAGFVTFRIEQDGKPVSGYVVEVFDAVGGCVSRTEGDSDTFAWPPRSRTCRLQVTVNGKSCDSVLLFLDERSVVQPSRVQLTFGDRSCCRSSGHVLSSFGGDDGEGEDARQPRTWPLVAVGVGCLAAAALVLVPWRRVAAGLRPGERRGVSPPVEAPPVPPQPFAIDGAGEIRRGNEIAP
jgi:hypothetical protein